MAILDVFSNGTPEMVYPVMGVPSQYAVDDSIWLDNEAGTFQFSPFRFAASSLKLSKVLLRSEMPAFNEVSSFDRI